MAEVRTRIAPSPTGFPHLGTIYQAMFDFFFAKKAKGQFVVRLEDTDRSRFVEGAEEVIHQALEWFGLKPNEDPIVGGPYGPYRSSERLEIYRKYVDQLLESGHAYRCFCSKERLDDLRKLNEAEKLPSKYDRRCFVLTAEQVKTNLDQGMEYIVRMKIPSDRTLVVHDALVGNVEFDSNLIDDQVILKSDGYPTYHLAAVVDDYLMKITHIFRGREWLSSTPKHLLLYEFLGWEKELPIYIHLPLILSGEGPGKLSKREGHASVDFYRHEGYLAEAVLNYLANLVWNNPSGKEIYPIEEFMEAFVVEPFKVKITSQGARFDLKKLEWMNGEYIRAMSDEELDRRLSEYLVDHPSKDKLRPLIPLVKERIKKLSDFGPLTNFLFEGMEYDRSVFNRIKIEDQKAVLEKVVEELEQMVKPWDAKVFEETFRKIAEEQKLSASDMFQLIRVAFSGQLVTPPLFEIMQFVGEDEAIKRVKGAISFLST